MKSFYFCTIVNMRFELLCSLFRKINKLIFIIKKVKWCASKDNDETFFIIYLDWHLLWKKTPDDTQRYLDRWAYRLLLLYFYTCIRQNYFTFNGFLFVNPLYINKLETSFSVLEVYLRKYNYTLLVL